jgi:hypothetical protein
MEMLGKKSEPIIRQPLDGFEEIRLQECELKHKER